MMPGSTVKLFKPHRLVAFLGIGLAGVMTVMVILGVLALTSVRQDFDTFAEEDFPAFNHIIHVDRDLFRAQRAVETAFMTTNPAARADAIAEYESQVSRTESRWQSYLEVARKTPGELELQAKYAEHRPRWLDATSKLVEMADQPAMAGDAAVDALLADGTAHFLEARSAVHELEEEFYEPLVEAGTDQGVHLGGWHFDVRLLLLILLGIGLAVGSVATWTAVKVTQRQYNDLREQDKAEARWNERFRSFVESTKDVITVVSGDESFTVVSSYPGPLSASPSGLTVSTLENRLTPPTYASWLAADDLLSKTGSSVSVEVEFTMESGGLAVFEAHGSSIGSERTERVWVWRDVTELQVRRARTLEMEQELRSQEHERAKLASLADSMAAGLVMIDPTGEVSYSNTQVGEFFGMSGDDLVLEDESQLEALLTQSTADPAAASSSYQDLSSEEGAWRTENFVLIEPCKRVLRCSMFPVRDAAGRDLGKGLLLSDVSREAEVEQMKDDFIGIASHELRTPLSGIMGFTELLRDGLPSESLERQWAGRVNEEARRLSALVSDLLDVSRIDSGSMEIHPEVFSLTDCLTQVVERAMSGCPERKIVLKTDERLSIEADQAKVIQVTTNLLDNALKYSPESEPVEIVQRLTGQAVEIRVRDRGAGIPRDQVEHIFEKFYRLETANPKIRGTGLGLYITRQLVERMGGRIVVQSQPGEGSSFILTLPLAQPEARVAA